MLSLLTKDQIIDVVKFMKARKKPVEDQVVLIVGSDAFYKSMFFWENPNDRKINDR